MPQSKNSQTATHTLKLKRKNTPVVGPFYIYETKYKYIYVYIYMYVLNIYIHIIGLLTTNSTSEKLVHLGT